MVSRSVWPAVALRAVHGRRGSVHSCSARRDCPPSPYLLHQQGCEEAVALPHVPHAWQAEEGEAAVGLTGAAACSGRATAA